MHCRVHSDNLDVLNIGGDRLQWSLMCPGILRDAGPSTRQLEGFTFTEEAPIWMPRFLLKVSAFHLLAALIGLVQLKKFSASLDDIAAVMVDDIAAGGKYSKVRVGVRSD